MIKILNYLDKEEWKNHLLAMKANDVFFSPEYLKVNEQIMEGEAECFLYEDSQSKIMYPYIKRPIKGYSFYDITSPYGYGGYIVCTKNNNIMPFLNAFHHYCIDEGIITEFIRFHPLFSNHRFFDDTHGQLIKHQSVVVANLDKDDFNLKSLVKKEAWKKVRKAENNFINVIEDKQYDYYDNFLKLYYNTMDLKQASRFYYFNRYIFKSIKTNLSNTSLMLIALHQKRVVGGLLIFYEHLHSYNFLSCSDYEQQNLGINDILQFKALEWSYMNGIKRFMLGGGRKGDDDLYRFKSKFSPDKEDFFLGRVIHQTKIYAMLCEECSKEVQDDHSSNTWFPLYRYSDSRGA